MTIVSMFFLMTACNPQGGTPGSSVANVITPIVVAEPMVVPQQSVKDDSSKEDVRINSVSRLDLRNSNLTFLLDEVTDNSVDKIINDINGFNSQGRNEIYLVINSPGGSVVAGSRLIGVIEASPSKVNCIVTGLAASMAFHILEHCNQRMGTRDSFIMSHNASITVQYQGEIDKLVSRYQFFQRYVYKMELYAAKRAGMTYTEFKLFENREMWYDTEDAIRNKFMDSIVSLSIPSISEFNSTNKFLKEIRGF